MIANPAKDCRRINPRSEAGALVIRSQYLIKGSRGRITPDLRDVMRLELAEGRARQQANVDQTKGSTA